MGKVCCVVVGCTSDSHNSKDIGFFKFPSDKSAKQQWRDQLNMKNKRLTSTSQICSEHFDTTDYKVTKGKWRLNKDAVPIRAKDVENNGDCGPPPPSPSKCEDRLQESPPRPPSPPAPPAPKYSLRSRRTYNTIIETCSDSERETSGDSETESDSEAKLKSRIENSTDTQQPTDHTTNNQTVTTNNEVTTTKHKQQTNVTESENPHRDKETQEVSDVNVLSECPVNDLNVLTSLDSDEPVDYESLIAQSNLINSKVLNKCPEPSPVAAEVSVHESSVDIEPPSPDCQMLVENVQVDIDPTTLLYMEDDISNHSGDEDIEVIPNAPVEPVSLLTSSDEDEVIIEEPVIPLVEVSDETDEEDMPLNKLHEKHKSKEKEVKKAKSKNKPLNKIFIKSGVNSDLYCHTCGYTTMKRSDFNEHMKEHLKPTRVRTIEVCHYCGYSTCSKDALHRHFRKHRHEKRFQCSLCDYKAKHRMSLIYHMKTHNLDDKTEPDAKKRKFGCHECSFETTNSKNLKRHISRRHKSSSGEEYRPGD